jgi:hypothetical protein
MVEIRAMSWGTGAALQGERAQKRRDVVTATDFIDSRYINNLLVYCVRIFVLGTHGALTEQDFGSILAPGHPS